MTRQIHLGNGNNGDEVDEDVYLSIRRSIRELFAGLGDHPSKRVHEIKVKAPKVINNVVEHYHLSRPRGNILIAYGAEPEVDMYRCQCRHTSGTDRRDGRTALSLRGSGEAYRFLPKTLDGDEAIRMAASPRIMVLSKTMFRRC